MRFVLIPVLWIAVQAPAEEKARPYDSVALQKAAIALERPLEGAELTLEEALKRITREHRVTIAPSTFTPEERARRVGRDRLGVEPGTGLARHLASLRPHLGSPPGRLDPVSRQRRDPGDV